MGVRTRLPAWIGRPARARSLRGLALALAGGLLTAPGPGPLAADRPASVTLLKVKEPRAARGRRLKLRMGLEPGTSLPPGQDPRLVGARIEIAGSLPGEAAAAVSLPPSFWHGRGNPPGSRGFTYVDRRARTGVRKVVVELARPGRRGASLTLRARGRNMPFRLARTPAPIDIRFAIGTELYCGQVVDWIRIGKHRLLARDAAAPASCGAATAVRCGDGIAVGVEECDDANTVHGDGCTPSCALEDETSRCAGVPTNTGTALTSVRVAAGLDNPVHITAPRLDTNRLFVVEQPGRVRIIENGVLRPDAFLSIEERVSCCGERGLLSIAFDPDFEANGRVFANYTTIDGSTIIARYELGGDPDRIDPTTERRLLQIEQPAGNHNGGQIAFGPDGFLYVAMGDGGGGGDPDGNAQNDASLLGKLLRLDVAVDAPPYFAAPPGNPTPGAPAPLGLVWAKGLRNPWRFSFDRETGDLYIGDVGQSSWEEIDVQPAMSAGGENYGWDIFEGAACFEPPPPANACPSSAGFTRPVHTYPNFRNPMERGAGCSVTGGFVYRGCAMPALRGTYFYGDFCSAFVRTFVFSNGSAKAHADRTAELAPPGDVSIDAISSFGEDARGEIYIADREDGEIFKIVPGG